MRRFCLCYQIMASFIKVWVLTVEDVKRYTSTEDMCEFTAL